MIVNPAAWTHYSYAIRDALELFEAPIVEVHLSNVDEREEWRRKSVISDVVAHRVDRQGPEGYKEAIEWLSQTRVSERVERLRDALEEPLLVTTGVNVRYLTGFESSNAALLVDEERVLLFTDFRYAEAARAIDGRRARSVAALAPQDRRREAARAAHRLRGERAHLRRLGDGCATPGSSSSLGAGLVERLRAVKDEAELATIREVARITDEALRGVRRGAFVGRTERDLAWRMEQLFHELGADAVAFEIIVGSGPNGALPHGRADRPRRRAEHDASSSTPAPCSTATTRTARARSRPATFRTTSLEAYDVCLRGAARRPRGDARRASPARTPTRRRGA